MIQCCILKNPNPPPKRLGLISKRSEVAEHTISSKKSAAFLCINNELSEDNENDPFTIASKSMKYLGIWKITDLYTENYKPLMQEAEEDSNKWKAVPCSCTGSMVLRGPCDLAALQNQIEQPRMHMETQETPPGKEEPGGTTLPDFKLL